MKHRRKVAGYLLLFGLSIVSAVSVHAQMVRNPDDDPPIQINTTLRNIPVIVHDRHGRPIPDLSERDFNVFNTKTGAPSRLEFFDKYESPMRVAIIIDTSTSATDAIGNITKGAREFLKLLRSTDEAMIATFDNSIEVLQEFTPDQKKLKSALGTLEIEREPGSRMNDALHRVITKDFANTKGRKAIVVLTDGDVSGKTELTEILRALSNSDILVYPIFYQTRQLFPSHMKSITYSQLFATPPGAYLNSLARASGGRVYAAEDTNFSTAFKNVSDELRNEYVLGISADEVKNLNDIKIEVNREGAFVRVKQPVPGVHFELVTSKNTGP